MQCNQILTAADAYIQQQQIEIDALTQINTYNEDIIARKTRLIEQMKVEEKRWYKNPVYVSILGVLAGGLAVTLIER